MGLQGVIHDWALIHTHTHTHTYTKRHRKLSECSFIDWDFASKLQCRILPFRLVPVAWCFVFQRWEIKSHHVLSHMSCISWMLTLMTKKERYRGKGVREAVNWRVVDNSDLLNQFWEEVWERWPKVCCGHELVPFLVKGIKKGLTKALNFPQRTPWTNIYT